MDLVEDQPRKHPTPVPFCQNSLLKPTVPEVSLILQDNFENKPEKKSENFSGTEFQTYNAWRWKQMQTAAKNENFENKTSQKSGISQNCCPIKDKYFCSDIEKRKNEILYGLLDEPRRPLPPRPIPDIKNLTDSFFTNTSLDDNFDDSNSKKLSKPTSDINYRFKTNFPERQPRSSAFKDVDNCDKLQKIIVELNKQTEILQNQIEQLLKLQDVKDKQIEQLLKSQESKEKKIEQLLQNLESKDSEVEQLLKLREKQDHQLQDLIQAQEIKQKEILELIKKCNENKKKESCSVGIMMDIQMVDSSTNTSFDFNAKDNFSKEENNSVDGISCIRELDEKNGFDVNKSLSLCSSDLPTVKEHVPTPQSSIHVDIQDFHDSSDESDEESGLSNNYPMSSETSKPLGYTFYNNILSQVKDILQNSGGKSKENIKDEVDNMQDVLKDQFRQCNYVSDQRESIKTFQALALMENEKALPENKENKLPNEYLNFGGKDTSPSDISLKINALALKYLKQEQISQYNLQSQISNPHHQDVTIYNVTNLSFGSMRYVDRNQMLSKITEPQQMNAHKNQLSPAQLIKRKKKISLEDSLSAFGNVLDMNKLNQQPKLL